MACRFWKKQGFEADDIIATLAREAEAQGFEVVIVSGDKDLMQMISPHICMWDTLKDQVFDLKTVQERFGTSPAKWVDIMGLAGGTAAIMFPVCPASGRRRP